MSSRAAFTAPNGDQYRVGVRWFYAGRYHRTAPLGVKSTRYRVFFPVDGGEWYRLYRLEADVPAEADETELARQLAQSEYATTVRVGAHPVTDSR